MNIKSIVKLVLLSIILLSNLAAQKKATVAVLDFEGRNISQFEATALTDRLITELGNTETITLIERRQLERILEEQGLQQSGCTSEECVAEVGQLLGVQYMISGSINKLGGTYTIDAKMFSIETGENIKTVSRTLRGRIDELIPLMESIAWELVGLDKRKLETVAVLDFEGRGISQMEAATLTDRFTTALGNTEAILLVARQEMQEILKEQGFKQQNCTSVECAAEVGALIGVKNIVNGAVGKIGETYTIDAQMINVSTGATVKTVSKTYTGRIDGLITEIEIMAWEIVGIKPPEGLIRKQRSGSFVSANLPKIKTQRGAALRSTFVPGWGQFYSNHKKWGYSLVALETIGLGLYIKSYNDYQNAEKDYMHYLDLYRQTTDTDLIALYHRKMAQSHDLMEIANRQEKIYLGAIGGIWTISVIHAYLYGPRDENTAFKNVGFNIVYDKQYHQTQAKVSIGIN